MKKRIIPWMLLLALLLSMTACQKKETGGEDKAAQGGSFRATIVELTADMATVKPLEEEAMAQSADRLTFSIQNLADRQVAVGDIVQITYTGAVRETDPAQLDVTDWRIVEKGGNAESSDRTILGNGPPTLTVTYGDLQQEVTSGSAEWSYFDAESHEMVTTALCGLSPLEGSVVKPTLKRTAEQSVTLSLPVRADSMTVRCWPEERIGSKDLLLSTTDGQGQILPVTDGKVTLPDGSGGFVLQVGAVWENEGSTTSYGNAQYHFLVTAEG